MTANTEFAGNGLINLTIMYIADSGVAFTLFNKKRLDKPS